MSAWHSEAEDWAHVHIQSVASVPIYHLTPALAPAVAGLAVLIGPSSMAASTLRQSGSLTADMRVTVTIRAAGMLPADLAAMSAETDAIVAALARGGARELTTAAGTSAGEGTANPLPARTVTVTITIEGAC